jgi:uncharacterized membrane protein YphA (DoxX/SURF4 family)
MKKANKIIYWIATVWLALGMVSTGAIQLIHHPDEVASMERLGYPLYLLTLLGIWKMLGAIAVLIPKFPLVKEWAYAGFFFAITGATYSRIAAGEPISAVLPPVLLLVLTVVSWWFRPADRKLVSV